MKRKGVGVESDVEVCSYIFYPASFTKGLTVVSLKAEIVVVLVGVSRATHGNPETIRSTHR
uniref:Uncharacterized protein n=1 Tax=uncultured marine virus TaxID=186617 RepID=A0A0F7L8E8_9VIRU|nr:hypothetical protein [uncultured marine virus]